MVEHPVQIKEQSSNTYSGASLDVPAPMVERAFRLLDLMVDAEEGVALSDLARRLKMSKGSLHGLLKTLEACCVIEQREDRLYALGPRMYNLAAYIWSSGVRRLALPAMQRLATNIGETIFLARVEQDISRVIESVDAGGDFPVPHIAVPPGTRIPLLAGVPGRLLMASWSEQRRETWLKAHPLLPYTPSSITDPDRFLAAVQEVAQTGIATEREEYLVGVNAVGVPIAGPGEKLVAMLCALGFAVHFNEEAMQHAAHLLRAEAEMITRALQFP